MDDTVYRRKRRRVATRSCQLCRQRKQRCELPDTEIEDSTEPLGPDKACHRCTVLHVDCVVDDRGTLKYAPARRLRRKQEANGSPAQETTPAIDVGSSEAGPSNQDEHIDEGDLMRTFEPYQRDSHTRTALEDTTQAGGPSSVNRLQNGLRYHGRPQSITEVMIQMASRRSRQDGTTESELSPEVLQALQAAYPKFLIFYPYLPDWPEIVEGSDPGSCLRRHLVIYLLLPHLPEHLTPPSAQLVRDITRLRDQVLRTLARSAAAVHALLILSQASPLGILPLDHVGVISAVGRQRGLHVACGHLVQVTSGHNRDLFAFPSAWTYLQHRSNVLAESLEEDPPSPILDAFELGRLLFNDPSLVQYAQDEYARDPSLGPSRVIGKLEILERVVRLDIVHLAVALIQDIQSEAAYKDENLLQTISDRLSDAVKQLEQVDERLSLIIAALNMDISKGLAETWMTYRNVCFQYHLGKLYRTAIRSYIATAFLPGLECGTLCPATAPHDPHALACDPQNVHLFFTSHPPPPARQYILPILVARVEGIAPLLQNFLSLDPHSLLPWHQTICMAVDTCNVIMEIQAGTLAFGDLDKPDVSRNFRLQEFAQLKKMLATISNNLQAADSWPVANTSGAKRTLGDIAAKLIGAMVRVMEGRVRRFAQERTGAGPADSLHPDPAHTGESQVPPGFFDHPVGSSLGSTPLPANSSGSSPSEFSAAELDQMFAEIFNTTYPGIEWLNVDAEGSA